MVRAPPLIPFRHVRPTIFTPVQLISVGRIKAAKISAVHVSTTASETMASDQKPHPSFEIIGGGAARDSILPALKTLTRPYSPFPFIGWNCHVETIFASFFRSLPDVRLRRECIPTKDNGVVSLDWVSGEASQLPPESPVLILLVQSCS